MEKNIVFPIVTCVFYFWSLAGSWLFCLDKITGIGESIGLKYYYLMDKMFKVELDGTYYLVILLYGLFICTYQLVCLRFLKKKMAVKPDDSAADKRTVKLTSLPIVLVAIFCLIGSFLIVKEVIFFSLILSESVYINVRSSGVNYYSFHQYFNWTMILSLYVYLGLHYSQGLRFIQVKKPSIIFWIMFFLANIYLVLIGSRHETFLAGIIALLLFSFPHRSLRKSLKLYIPFFVFFGLILVMNDPIRAMLPNISSKLGFTQSISTTSNKKKAELFQLDRTFIVHRSETKSKEFIRLESLEDTIVMVYSDSVKLKKLDLTIPKKEFFDQIKDHPNFLMVDENQLKLPNSKISGAYRNMNFIEKAVHSVTSILFSNELFAGHFSLYGIIKYDVKPKFGLSFRALLEIIKPKSSRNSEVLDSYAYYSKELNFPKDQGFTINHVSGWYLNFSYFGIPIGGAFLTFLILGAYIKQKTASTGPKELIWLIVLCSITAFTAMLVRGGPEAFKALIVEAIIIPVVIFFGAILFTRISSKITAKVKGNSTVISENKE
ncbi:MAG: hypothetical protein QNL61_10920 [Crocinitomicaceae bacterium]